MEIRINTHGNPLPEKHGDWVDLLAAEDVTLPHGGFALIDLGVSMELPYGYYAEIVPRSSLYLKYGLIMANGIGIIDRDYCGDDDIWRFPAICLREGGTHISKGTRICQFRLVRKPPVFEFEQVEKLDGDSRGGFGSTG